MHNQPYVGRIALGTRKKLLKSGEIRNFYSIWEKNEASKKKVDKKLEGIEVKYCDFRDF